MKTSGQTSGGFPDIHGLLTPASVAVIGASDRVGNFGGGTIRNLLKFGYPGAIWPVNPNRQTVSGLACYPSPRDLPGPADLAVLTIPAHRLVDAIGDCAAAGIRHGVAFAGGFAETGGAGVELQKALVERCRQADFQLCGPNCVGIINAVMPMTATFATALGEVERFRPGCISMVSQSGGMATGAFALTQKAGFGFRYVVSSGNEAVVTFADYVHAFAEDEGTRVIVGYLEGITDGQTLLRALEGARNRRKPVVIMKAGTSKASARAAQAHTGAMAGEDRVYDAIFREMAVIRVYSLEEAVDVAATLSGIETAKLPTGPGVGIITFGGGGGVSATDQCAQNGLSTPSLRHESVGRLKQLLVPVATAANPMDLTPQTLFQPEWLARLPEALDVLASEPEIHTLLFKIGSNGSRAREIMDVIVGLRNRCAKTVLASWSDTPKGVPEHLATEGMYCVGESARATRTIGRLVRYQTDLARPPSSEQREVTAFDWAAFVPAPSAHAVIPEHQCHRILAEAGLTVAAGQVAGSAEEAVRAAKDVGLPVALKGVSSTVTHRAAAGLLAVDLRTQQEVRAAYRRLMGRAAELHTKLDGIYVQHMVSGGMELLVSAFRDPFFGPMLTCGAGGNLTELIDDVVIERAPVDDDLAVHMLEQLRVVRRARQADQELDLRLPARFISSFSKLAATAPWSRFILEVNPIKCSRDSVVAVDGLLIIEQP